MNPIDRWFPRIVLATALVVCGLDCPSEAQPARDVLMEAAQRAGAIPACGYATKQETKTEAQPARVEAAQLCAVKSALHRGLWSPQMCERVADALNSTPDPVMFASMMVNESDLREDAVVEPVPGKLDVGLLGVRCILDRRDRCMNAPVIGLHWTALSNPEANIHASAAVYAMHAGSLRRYSGSTRERGYGARIVALVAAFGGELRIPKGATGKKWARAIGLAKRIVQAINERKQS